MKVNGNLLLITIFLLSINSIWGQKAKGGCDKITVTEIPAYPLVYFAMAFRDCAVELGDGDCCRIAVLGFEQMHPKLWLEKEGASGDWVEVGEPKFGAAGTVFTNLDPHDDHGTYRVRILTPFYNENSCKEDRPGNIIQARIAIFNTLAQFLGYWGTYDNTPFGGNASYYTNEVIVGPSTPDDISYTFTDVPETGSEQAYDFGEPVKIDVSQSKNYDLWWLSIGESGPNFNRYRSNGWSVGNIDEYNLRQLWDGGDNWDFETFHAYNVQFVIENRACRNGIEYPAPSWNNLKRSFFVCPTGSGCRLGNNSREIIVSPNPASTFIRLQNFDPESGGNYQVRISDLVGNVYRDTRLYADEIAIEDLPEGIFVLNIWQKGKHLLSRTLVVNR